MSDAIIHSRLSVILMRIDQEHRYIQRILDGSLVMISSFIHSSQQSDKWFHPPLGGPSKIS